MREREREQKSSHRNEIFRTILNKIKKNKINTDPRLELGLDEIKKCHSNEQIKMVWKSDANER